MFGLAATLVAGCGSRERSRTGELATDKAMDRPEPFVRVVNAAGTADSLVQVIVAETRRHTGIELRVDSGEPRDLPLEGDARTIAQAMDSAGSGALLTVWLVSLGAPRNALHLALNRSGASAVIDVALLRHEDSTVKSRRIERQLTRALAFSLGLSPSPDFFCVTWNYATLEQLDRMGRNFNPVTAQQFREAAVAEGWLPSEPVSSRRQPAPSGQ